jgi:hypothetical protein
MNREEYDQENSVYKLYSSSFCSSPKPPATPYLLGESTSNRKQRWMLYCTVFTYPKYYMYSNQLMWLLKYHARRFRWPRCPRVTYLTAQVRIPFEELVFIRVSFYYLVKVEIFRWPDSPSRVPPYASIKIYKTSTKRSGPKREEVAGGWKRPHNDELHNLYLRQISLGWSNQGGWDVRGIEHAWKRREMHTKFWSENLKGRDYSDDLGVEGKVILKWIFGK